MKYKITICGDQAVGKTSYIKKIISKQFNIKYIPSTKLSIYNIKPDFYNFEVDFWDMPSNGFSLKDAYIVKSDLVLLMLDVTDEDTYDSLYSWYRDIQLIDPKIPIIILANKCESIGKDIEKLEITFHKKYDLKLFDISCKTGKNIDSSFNYCLNFLKTKNEAQDTSEK